MTSLTDNRDEVKTNLTSVRKSHEHNNAAPAYITARHLPEIQRYESSVAKLTAALVALAAKSED